jgi:hypothetical protein
MISAAALAAESPPSRMLEMEYTKDDLKVLKAHSKSPHARSQDFQTDEEDPKGR